MCSRMFIDVDGRTVLFHGVNVVYKVPPYIPSNGAFDPSDSLNDEDIENLVKLLKSFEKSYTNLGESSDDHRDT